MPVCEMSNSVGKGSPPNLFDTKTLTNLSFWFKGFVLTLRLLNVLTLPLVVLQSQKEQLK